MIKKTVSWVILAVCALYLVLPLLTQFDYSLRAKRNEIGFTAYTNLFKIQDSGSSKEAAGELFGQKVPRFFSAMAFSLMTAVLTIAVSTLIIVPTAYWVNLRVPHLKPLVEFVTVLPFAIPGVVLVFGLLRTYSGPPLNMTRSDLTTLILLIGGYTVFVMPYTYRTVDAGLRAIDIRTLTDAARSLGAGWGTVIWRVILPNLRVAVISAALLTFAVAIGEFTLANFLFPDERAFGSYLASIGRNKFFEPAALTIISFALVWVLVSMIQRVARGTNQTPTGIR